MIHARGLARTFKTRRGPVEAVSGVDIDVDPGELVGFLGPNGAGKTTTLRMLTTLLAPTAGSATVAGCDLLTDPVGVRRRIGYVGQSGGAGPDCLVADELILQGRFYGLTQKRSRERAAELLDQLDLTGTETRVVSTLSGGQRRRLDIAMGLMHLPTLLFMDEPSTGLDPQSRANLWGHIRALHAEHGTTLFLTTHYLDEADALCDRILVIDKGQIVAEGTPDELKRRVSGDLVLVGTTEPTRAAALTARIPDSTEHAVDGNTVRFRVPDGASVLPTLLRELTEADVGMTSVEVRRPSLDDASLTCHKPHHDGTIAARDRRGGRVTTATETWLIFQRSMKQSLRNPAWVIIGIIQPVLYLALFGPLLVPVIQNTPGFPPGDAYQVLVPALLVQLGLFGSLFVGFGLISEYRAGVIERMRVTPVSRVALLLGRSLKDVVVLVVQGILLTVLALFFGLRTPFGGVVVALLLVAVLALAMSSASYSLALILKSEDTLAPVLNTIVLPLLLLSGILLPMTLAPTWLYDLSRVNPFVYVVDAERAIFRGDFGGSVVIVGIVVAVVLVFLTVGWGVRTFQRESA